MRVFIEERVISISGGILFTVESLDLKGMKFFLIALKFVNFLFEGIFKIVDLLVFFGDDFLML